MLFSFPKPEISKVPSGAQWKFLMKVLSLMNIIVKLIGNNSNIDVQLHSPITILACYR